MFNTHFFVKQAKQNDITSLLSVWYRMKNGVEVPTGVRSRYRVKSDGTKHWLIIDEATKDDTGTYSLMATGGTTEAHVQVDRMIILLFESDICLKELS